MALCSKTSDQVGEPMKKTKILFRSTVLVFSASVLLFAGERGTPAEAKAMLQKAIAHYKEVGRKQALADFNAKKPPFGDRDLYVFCIGRDLTIVANGGFPQYVGYPAG